VRIAYIVPSWPPGRTPNGIVTYVDQITKAKENEKSVVLPLGYDPLVQHDSSRVIPRVDSKLRIAYRKLAHRLTDASRSRDSEFLDSLARQVQTAKRKFGADVVEIEETFGWAGDLQEKIDLPVAVRLHGPWFLNGPAVGVPQDDAYHERLCRERDGISKCCLLTSPSKDVLDRVRDFYKLSLPMGVVIPNAAQRPHWVKTWQKESSLSKTILYVGRFDAHKGADIVVDAFALLADSDPDIRLVMIGPNHGVRLNDRTYLFEEYCVLKRIPQNVRNRIQFLGRLPNCEVWDHRMQAGQTVVASRYENFPYAALESLLVGSPTVFSNAGGIPEILTHDLTGRAFQSGDPSSLAQELEYCLRNPDRMLEFSRNALNESVQFEPNRVFQQFQNYYSQNDAH